MGLPEPYELYDRYCDQQAKEEERFPICDYCGEPITDDWLIDINGDLFHEECHKENHRKPVEYYMK